MGSGIKWRYLCLLFLFVGSAILGLVYYVNPERNVFSKVYISQTKLTEPDIEAAKQTGDKLMDEVQTTVVNIDTSTVTIESLENIDGVTDSSTGGFTNSSKVIDEMEKIEDNFDIKLVTNPTTNRRRVEQILRDSITNHHMANFEKPQNETRKRRLPICIVIGVCKSGTREIMDFMRLHPHIEIFHSTSYEMPYFGTAYRKGKAWFKSQMPRSYSNQITVVKNAWYFHFHKYNIPERIKKFNESLKLIVLVREPVSRAISQYMFFHRRLSKEHFENVVLRGNAVNSKAGSLVRSVYDEPMEKWLQYFKLDQFLFIESNELKSNPAGVMRKVEDFLGLGHYITPDMFVLNEEKGFYCIQSNLTVSGMACYAENRGRKQISVEPSTISKLKEYFRPKNERFFNIIGNTYDWE